MAWFSRLRQASFRGINFGVRSGLSRFGRRNVVHQYPNRDDIWIEDLGREARRIHLAGFLIEDSLVYGGGDAIDQRDRLVAAAEGQDTGKLVHPTLGEMIVSLISVDVLESWDQGRVFELDFTFMEAGLKRFPAVTIATQEFTFITALKADVAAAQDFVSRAQETFDAGAAVIHDAVNTSAEFIQLGQHLVADASNLYNLVVDLPGEFGRFFGVGLKGITNATQAIVEIPQTLPDLIARGAANRVTFDAAAATLLTAAASITQRPDDFSSAAQALVGTVLGTSIDPLTALRILQRMSEFDAGRIQSLPVPRSSLGVWTVIAQAINDGRGFAEQLFRRACLACMARAAANYGPSSYDDAVRIRNLVCDAIEAVEVAAADAGDDDTFSSMRALRFAVAQDMQVRGANLGEQMLVTLRSSVSSLVLAQILYRDASRADELVAEANPVHPAFLPTTFYALSK